MISSFVWKLLIKKLGINLMKLEMKDILFNIITLILIRFVENTFSSWNFPFLITWLWSVQKCFSLALSYHSFPRVFRSGCFLWCSDMAASVIPNPVRSSNRFFKYDGSGYPCSPPFGWKYLNLNGLWIKIIEVRQLHQDSSMFAHCRLRPWPRLGSASC